MRRFFPLLTLLVLPLFAQQAQAQFRFLPYVGYNTSAGYDLDGILEAEDEVLPDPTGGILVGVGAEFPIALIPTLSLKLRPSVETVFLSGDDASMNVEGVQIEAEASQSLYQFSGDVILEFAPPLSPIVPYAGVGLTYLTYSLDLDFEGSFGGESADFNTETSGSALGANLLAGVRFGSGFASPFVQVRYSLADPSPDEAVEDGETIELDLSDDERIGNGFSIMAGISFGL